MSDAAEVQHHLEHGLLHLSRGMVFEARDLWRKVLQIEPTNSSAIDYIQSTEKELNDYDRQREAELVRLQSKVPRRLSGEWDDDELEVISPGPAEEESFPGPGALSAATRMDVGDETAEEAAIHQDAAPTGWISVPEGEDDWEGALGESTWDSFQADGTELAEAVEAVGDEDDDEADPFAGNEASEEDPFAEGVSSEGEPYTEDETGVEDEESLADEEVSAEEPEDEESLADEEVSAEDDDSFEDEEEFAALYQEPDVVLVAAADDENDDAEQGERGDSGAWEPLDWMNEDTPTAGLKAGSDPEARNLSVVDEEIVPGLGPSGMMLSDESDEDVFAGEDTASDGRPRVSEEEAVERLLERVAKEEKQGRLSAARDLLKKRLTASPGRRELVRELDRIEKKLRRHCVRVLGSLENVPELKADVSDIYSLDLDQVGGYILSLIDGVLTLDDIYTLSSHVDQLTVMGLLAELLEAGIITLRHA